jgi:uncharacterized protein YdiU (UPF0061 family)
VAHWLSVGFIHGVMNTDNMTVSGETIDYGPCAFMDFYDPAQVYSSIDQNGRYAYGNQPGIAQWNLLRLAETLLPVLAPDQPAALEQAQAAVDSFPTLFQRHYTAAMNRKFGLTQSRPDDFAFAQRFLALMATNHADFTNIFRALADGAGNAEAFSALRGAFVDLTAFDAWASDWRKRLAEEEGSISDAQAIMRAANPAFIPRNHRIEEMIVAAVEKGDYAPFETLLGVLARPYDDQPENAQYANPPREDEIVQQTFCGT